MVNNYPKYNSDTKRYEITSKEELIAMSSGWCIDMPKYATYVLLNDIDMEMCDDFIPIGYKRERAFVGTFDGNGHCIKNLKVESDQKYVALFKYLGNKESCYACVKNLIIENCMIKGSRNVASIAGVNYGRIENCVVTGTIMCDSNEGSHGVGGICGKNKAYGVIKNCMVNVNVEGSYDVGGIVGIQEEGGAVERCFVRGTIKANDDNGMVGGVVGSFNAGDNVRNCVVGVKSISGRRYVGKIIGQFEDENCENVKDNIVWEGIHVLGNENGVIDAQVKSWEDIKEYVLDKHSDVLGVERMFLDTMTIDSTIITSTPVNRIKKRGELKVEASVLSNQAILGVSLCYWNNLNKDVQMVAMSKDGNMYKGSIKDNGKSKRIYYYIKVEAETTTTTWPYYKNDPVLVNVGDYGMQKRPSQITLTMGNDLTNVGVNWVTHNMITDTVLWYKKKEDSEWRRIFGVNYIIGKGELRSHKVRMKDLDNDTVYEYKVGDTRGHESRVMEFRIPKPSNFSFLFVADPQAVSRKDYDTFRKCMECAMKRKVPDFIVNAGDITQNGYKNSEWRACFDVLGEYFSKFLTITIPGNHENKGDPYFSQYVGRFFMPKVSTRVLCRETLGEFKCGAMHIVTLNTEMMKNNNMRERQLNWLKETFSKSRRKWKILVVHRGMYMVNHSSKKIRAYFSGILEKLGVCLVLNGHDHVYTRATQNGITYITGGTCGNKFYEYINDEQLDIDVWRDDKGCQTYSIVNVTDKVINIEVYSKETKDDWNKWILIDKIELH